MICRVQISANPTAESANQGVEKAFKSGFCKSCDLLGFAHDRLVIVSSPLGHPARRGQTADDGKRTSSAIEVAWQSKLKVSGDCQGGPRRVGGILGLAGAK